MLWVFGQVILDSDQSFRLYTFSIIELSIDPCTYAIHTFEHLPVHPSSLYEGLSFTYNESLILVFVYAYMYYHCKFTKANNAEHKLNTQIYVFQIQQSCQI